MMVGIPKISKTAETALLVPSNDESVRCALEQKAERQCKALSQTMRKDFARGYEILKKLVFTKIRLELENGKLRKDKKSLQREYNRLLHAREHDDLTGLYTRHFMMHSLEELSEQANLPHEERRSMDGNCLLMIDLDKFKPINDAYGHQAGDRALETVAEALRKNIRKTDIAARLGGDEFVIILQGASKRGGEIKVERIRKLFETLSFEWQGVEIPIRASIGCCAIDCTKTAIEIMQEADEYMYQCKKAKGAARDQAFTAE